ncbi:uncharacterized protein LOC123220765 isoform X3 [Mangifera indica]|uniref:uncharacterized protein LOC123220765 isoform X3 n=1 Tax=Mangifera indica TaxID=29780 RepID=UPI001CFAEA0D|nr:uncharacterized protein LOC123220765 isoform X3 [Mangifera indica]
MCTNPFLCFLMIFTSFIYIYQYISVRWDTQYLVSMLIWIAVFMVFYGMEFAGGANSDFYNKEDNERFQEVTARSAKRHHGAPQSNNTKLWNAVISRQEWKNVYQSLFSANMNTSIGEFKSNFVSLHCILLNDTIERSFSFNLDLQLRSKQQDGCFTCDGSVDCIELV